MPKSPSQTDRVDRILLKQLIGLRQPRAEWFETLPAVGPEDVSIRYLGTAGFVISDKQRALVLDPFITRPGLVTTLTRRLCPDGQSIQKHIPRADDVLVGHAHYDHVLDAPDLCVQTGARLIGARATINVARAAGVPETQLRETAGREDIACGCWNVRGLPSVHGKALAGRIPLPGDITKPPPWPARITDLRHGLVLNWMVETPRLRIVHIDSADFIDAELAQQHADVVCLCAIGRKYRPHYVRDVVRLLRPKWVIPCHWDTMMTPIESPPDLIPGVDLAGFLQEIRDAGAIPLLMPLLSEVGLSRGV